jgi:hypothetical protein
VELRFSPHESSRSMLPIVHSFKSESTAVRLNWPPWSSRARTLNQTAVLLEGRGETVCQLYSIGIATLKQDKQISFTVASPADDVLII